LRTWESRYGYPVPERKPSGHRVYPLASVPRLRRIAEALARGHRAGQVVVASDVDLAALLETLPPAAAQPAPAVLPSAETLDVSSMLGLVAGFDAARLTRVLLGDWARLSPVAFLETRIAPLLRGVGLAWEKGELEVRHEHFLAERVGDLLRSLRLPFEERATGPLVVLGSLPGEAHALGLQMAALTLAAASWRVLFLGTEVPIPQMAGLARDLGARSLALSVSLAQRGPATNAGILKLRQLLPRRTTLLVGGEGAPRQAPGVQVISDLAGLESWARSVTLNARPPAHA
jgi:methanogenic corrinoid protein MtbC1